MTDSLCAAGPAAGGAAARRLRYPLLLSALAHCLLLLDIGTRLPRATAAPVATVLAVQLSPPNRQAPVRLVAPAVRHTPAPETTAPWAKSTHQRHLASRASTASDTADTTPPPPPEATASSTAHHTIAPVDQAPSYRQIAAPPYPLWSRRHQEQGVVQLRVLIGADGQVLQVTLAQSSGFPRLDQAASQAVRTWHFTPGSHQGQPVTAEVQVPVSFSLRQP